MQFEEVLDRLKTLANPEAVDKMKRFGITANNTYGVSIPDLRILSKEIGKNHPLALKLWSSGIHDARLLASLIDDPKKVTEQQMESWAQDFNSWDICDQCANNLFRKTQFAYQKVAEWSSRKEEFIKRTGFAILASLAVHDKKKEDKEFIKFLEIIKREATDERNFVKKAINWALRQIGKRNLILNRKAIETATEIKTINSKSAKWIASDAIRELTSEKIQKRLTRSFKTK
ncbi:DNA alkylation repair protein [Candidatus Borrarchaeum sp.]|uniref:DNA alkylation repair protein n=1 Tax=Candidatus Borrarchaeum sp. TaxID=2846742 RepID=UPI002580A9CF|nr:DNA alkylation repair protein [Candidatus Borrarchaeum sp.]